MVGAASNWPRPAGAPNAPNRAISTATGWACAARRQLDQEGTAVGGVRTARDEALELEPVDHRRHVAGADAEAGAQLSHDRRRLLVQDLEQAELGERQPSWRHTDPADER